MTPNTIDDLLAMIDAHKYAHRTSLVDDSIPYIQFLMCDVDSEPMRCAAMIVDGCVIATTYDSNAGIQMTKCEGVGYASFKFWLDVFFG